LLCRAPLAAAALPGSAAAGRGSGAAHDVSRQQAAQPAGQQHADVVQGASATARDSC
jgi:hypothetical protein